MAPLLRRAARSDAAFERLYKRHVQDVYRYSLAVLGQQADAEDVTQTTFMNAYRAFQRGERPEKPENWLITIAHNVCRQRFRQAQRRPSEVEFYDTSASTAQEDDGPKAEDLRRAFAQLPASQREALVMRELEGRSYAEMASILGISDSALETLIFRARKTLREQLEGRLTCSEAAFAISKEADGRLPTDEQSALRAHLRVCAECATAARRQRAMRRALSVMLAAPLPQSLASFLGGGAAAAASTAGVGGATAIGLKAVAVLAAGVAVGGGTYVGVSEQNPFRGQSPANLAATSPPQPAAEATGASANQGGRPLVFDIKNRGRLLMKDAAASRERAKRVAVAKHERAAAKERRTTAKQRRAAAKHHRAAGKDQRAASTRQERAAAKQERAAAKQSRAVPAAKRHQPGLPRPEANMSRRLKLPNPATARKPAEKPAPQGKKTMPALPLLPIEPSKRKSHGK